MADARGALDRARYANRARAIGYRLLPGEGFSYILHLRPLEWPIMAGHTALGYLLARPPLHGEAGTWAWWAPLLGALAVWVVLLNGGTLAINSAFDRDEGDVGYLDAPPPPPARLAAFSLALMALGQGLSFLLPWPFALVYAACFAMSILYSVPPVRLKAVAGADWLINMIGFGTLTPLAGWAASGVAVSRAGAWAMIAFCPLFAALYPLTQLYQLDEDRARGDRTLAIAIGVRRSLLLSCAFALLAFAMFARSIVLNGADSIDALLLGAALAAWIAVLVPWTVRAEGMSITQHKRGMYAGLGAWAVTDVAMLAVFLR